jgi:protein-S-isoprenylcysteine O-methyltransferase Ste14
VLLFAAGVAMYRVAGRALGEALSPLVSPRPGAALVTSGPYRYLRHPMYVGQALIAVGAPLTLGCRWVVWLALPALLVLGLRMVSEEAALARTFPDYGGWAARAKRLIPFVF